MGDKHCNICGYSGNKGKVIGYDRLDGSLGKPLMKNVTISSNGHWSIPKSMVNTIKFCTINCPDCGSDDFH